MPKSVGGFGDNGSDLEKQIRDAFSDAAGALGGGASDGREGGNEDEAAKRANRFGITGVPEDIANLKPGQGYHSLSGMERLWAGIKGLFGGVSAAGQVAGGGPGGLVSGAMAGKRSIDNIRAAISGKQYTDENDKPMSGPLGNAGQSVSREGGNGAGGLASAANNALKPTTPTPTASSPIPNPFDYFTSKPRKKQGYQSTILGGGIPAPPKQFLGE